MKRVRRLSLDGTGQVHCDKIFVTNAASTSPSGDNSLDDSGLHEVRIALVPFPAVGVLH